MEASHTKMVYEMDISEAITALTNKLAHVEAAPDPLLADMDGPTCFNLGYAQALHDLKEITAVDPLKVELVMVMTTEEKPDGE